MCWTEQWGGICHVVWVCVCVWYVTSASRVLELKHEMVNLELLEFQYFDDILTDLKLTPVREHTTTHTLKLLVKERITFAPLV